MTRGQMIEIIIRQLAGGDPQWSFRWGDEREIGLHTDSVRDKIMWTSIMQEEGVNDNYITTYENVPVLYDTNRKQNYFDMPAHMLSLPKNKAIRQISRMKGQNVSFVILPATSSPFLTGLEGMLDGNVAVKIEGNKGFLFNMELGIDCGLLIMMVVVGKDVPEDDQYCPPFLEDTIKMETLKQLGVGLNVIEDKSNDKV